MTKNSQLILSEATALGLETKIISDSKHLFRIFNKSRSLLVCELFSVARDPYMEIYRFSKDKAISYALWQEEGVPHPAFHHFKNFEEFKKSITSISLSFPLITKESGGSKSMNVHMNIQSVDELFLVAQTYSKSFLVQQMVTGNEYRLLLYKGKLLGALQMIPPHVIGNGKNTIQELIDLKNINALKKIILSPAVQTTLKKNGLTLKNIPEKNTVVRLQENSRLSEGGSTRDCTAEVHPELLSLAWKSLKALNLDLSGIDIICENISLSPKEQSVYFLEANTYPDLRIHYYPTSGQPQMVIRPILRDIFNLPA